MRKLWKPWPSSSRAWRSSRCPIAAVTRSSVKPSPAKYAGRDDNLIGQGHKGEVGGVLEGDHAHLEQRAMHHLKTAATVCLVCVLVRVGGMGSKVGTCNKEHLSITAVNHKLVWLVDRLHGMDGWDYTVHQYFEQGFLLRDNFSVDCGLKCGFKKVFEFLIFLYKSYSNVKIYKMSNQDNLFQSARKQRFIWKTWYINLMIQRIIKRSKIRLKSLSFQLLSKQIMRQKFLQVILVNELWKQFFNTITKLYLKSKMAELRKHLIQ